MHCLLCFFLFFLRDRAMGSITFYLQNQVTAALCFVQHGSVSAGWGQRAVSSWLKHHDPAGPAALRGCMENLPRLWVMRWDANVMGHAHLGAGPRQMVLLTFLQEGGGLRTSGNLVENQEQYPASPTRTVSSSKHKRIMSREVSTPCEALAPLN